MLIIPRFLDISFATCQEIGEMWTGGYAIRPYSANFSNEPNCVKT